MEDSLLTAAICNSREAYERAKLVGLQAKDFSDAAKVIVDSAFEQYKRDPKLQSIDRAVMATQIQRKRGKEGDSIVAFLNDLPKETSSVNVLDEYRLLRLRSTGTLIAGRMAAGMLDSETDELLEQYQKLRVEVDDNVQSWRLAIEDFEESWDVIPLAPVALNRALGGGVPKVCNIVVFGRPNSGKSLLALNAAVALCVRGRKVMYVANEEFDQVITKRFLSRLLRIDIDKLSLDDIRRGMEHPAYQNWYLMHGSGFTTNAISLQAQAIKPDLIVIDQLHNLATRGDNRALQLDQIARGIRNIGIENECITLSVTQAGDSAHHKRVLDMNDVDWSNTGIPAAADLMIALGVDLELLGSNQRMLSFPKNKVNGKEGLAVKVHIDPLQTKMYNPRRRDS